MVGTAAVSVVAPAAWLTHRFFPESAAYNAFFVGVGLVASLLTQWVIFHGVAAAYSTGRRYGARRVLSIADCAVFPRGRWMRFGPTMC